MKLRVTYPAHLRRRPPRRHDAVPARRRPAADVRPAVPPRRGPGCWRLLAALLVVGLLASVPEGGVGAVGQGQRKGRWVVAGREPTGRGRPGREPAGRVAAQRRRGRWWRGGGSAPPG
ncbi:hypothetical protein ABZ793_03010 [Micromonospora sp. NPDC047465]|uniref:hypothetical protein n=1 Tax=Micromonospora sp. NPDC047465 TaxID=3154813 RepID=UPI0033CF4276